MEGGRKPDNVKEKERRSVVPDGTAGQRGDLKEKPMNSKTRDRLPMTTIVKVKFGPQNGFQHTLEIPFLCDNDISADFL